MVATQAIIIRTVTVFVPAEIVQEDAFEKTIAAAVQTAQGVRAALLNNNISVQTIRISLPSPAVFGSVDNALRAAHFLDQAAVDYASLGVVFPQDADFVSSDFYVSVIQQTKSVSIAASLTSPDTNEIYPDAVSAAAAAVPIIATLDDQGFSNLRFAAIANVLPNGPFFPGSYAPRTQPDAIDNKGQRFTVALGVQGATLVQHVISSYKDNVSAVYDTITHAIENTAELLVKACAPVSSVLIDFSTAPLPGSDHSIGHALATCASTDHFPGPGGLAVAARIADAIDRARFPRTGFCGIMLPVCEDDALASNSPNLAELLMCSSVCGTGLDVR